MGILHQHNGIGYGTRTTKHRNSKRSNGNIIGISLDFLVFQLHWGITGLQHIEANLKDNNSTGNTETIGRDTEELKEELPCKRKDHNCYKGNQSGARYYRLPFTVCHSMRHGQKHRHGAERVCQRKEGGKTK